MGLVGTCREDVALRRFVCFFLNSWVGGRGFDGERGRGFDGEGILVLGVKGLILFAGKISRRRDGWGVRGLGFGLGGGMGGGGMGGGVRGNRGGGWGIVEFKFRFIYLPQPFK